ncbi:MAG: hypothetical protein V9G12_26030 [Microthrixaceae bacterium]|jgi:hypothetical protein
MGILRRVGTPIRQYFNGHFEMVKDEVRRSSTAVHHVDAGLELRRHSDEMTVMVRSVADAVSESNAIVVRQLLQVRALADVNADAAGTILAQLGRLGEQLERQSDTIERLSARIAELSDNERRRSDLLSATADRTAFLEGLIGVSSGSESERTRR